MHNTYRKNKKRISGNLFSICTKNLPNSAGKMMFFKRIFPYSPLVGGGVPHAVAIGAWLLTVLHADLCCCLSLTTPINMLGASWRQ